MYVFTIFLHDINFIETKSYKYIFQMEVNSLEALIHYIRPNMEYTTFTPNVISTLLYTCIFTCLIIYRFSLDIVVSTPYLRRLINERN